MKKQGLLFVLIGFCSFLYSCSDKRSGSETVATLDNNTKETFSIANLVTENKQVLIQLLRH